MKKILVLFAHPKFERSKVNRALVEKIRKREGVTFHDLYERYPDFNIDVFIEKKLLSEHDVIIWHHPLYWYSCPPLLKHWIDLVLEFNWAYGPSGDALKGKQALNVITAGGTRAVYCSEGNNNYSINEFLRPFEQTARLCKMDYFPPFGVMGANGISDEGIATAVAQYDQLISVLQEGLVPSIAGRCDYLNDIPQLQTVQSI